MSKFLAAPSRLAFAMALATGAAIGMTATPAFAAKKAEEPAAPKKNYSKEFIAAYQPIAKVVDAGGDLAPVKAQVPAVVAAAKTPDDKYAAGQFAYSVGSKTSDPALERQGVDLMIDSGVVQGAERAKLLYGAAQLAYQQKDYAQAAARGQQAIDAGYTDNPELLVSEAYFAQNQTQQGLDLLDKAMARKVAAGQTIPEDWLKRALAMSYKAKLDAPSLKYSGMYAQYYPSSDSWGDAIAVRRNLYNYDGQELLDLLRLSAATNSLRSERDYVDYISASDARRLPGETQRIINAGLAAGKLNTNDVFVKEALSVASARAKTDAADLGALAQDARASGATIATVMAAGDTYLSYQQPDKAEEFYKKALTMPGVDTPRVLTRLGIAQLNEGKTAEAEANFAKVDGARQAIAQLWSIYAAQAAKGAPAAQ